MIFLNLAGGQPCETAFDWPGSPLPSFGEPGISYVACPPSPSQRAPKIRRSRLVRDVAEHPADLAALDLPKRLAAELEVVPLLVDRITAASLYQDALVDACDEIVLRDVLFRGVSETFGIRGNGTLPQLSACRQP